jgi:hypothetical protein
MLNQSCPRRVVKDYKIPIGDGLEVTMLVLDCGHETYKTGVGSVTVQCVQCKCGFPKIARAD